MCAAFRFEEKLWEIKPFVGKKKKNDKKQAAGIPVGVGTDMSGGPSPSIWDGMRGAIETSVAVWLAAGGATSKSIPLPLSYREAFYLGTVGGAQLFGMTDKLGNFVKGKWFNAQVINPFAENIDTFGYETIHDLFQKCFYLLDDRNIEQVFVKGKRVI
jgi:guanine deaminase